MSRSHPSAPIRAVLTNADFHIQNGISGHRCIPVGPYAVDHKGKREGPGRDLPRRRSFFTPDRFVELNRLLCFDPLLPIGRAQVEAITLDPRLGRAMNLRVNGQAGEAQRSEKYDQDDKNPLRNRHDSDWALLRT